MAGSLNRVFLIGRLGQDPKLTYTPSGTPVCNFTLATDESYTDKQGNRVDQAEWHRVVVWSRQAELAANYLAKGRLVFVEGRLQTRKWEDQQGQARYTTEIVATRVQFLDPKGQEGGGAPMPGRGGSRPGQAPDQDDDLGPAFPSEASGMDDVPF